MNKQEFFNAGARAIIKQGKPSVGDNGDCLYRGHNGLRCLIGHMITDEEYKPEIESDSAEGAVRILKLTRFKGLSSQFLNACQQAHDDAARDLEAGWSNDFVAGFKEKMRSVAKRYHVKADVLEETP